MSEEARSTLDQMRSSDWARQARDVATQARERVTDMKREAQQRFEQAAATVREKAPDVKSAVDRVTSAAGSLNEDEHSGNGNTRRDSLLELLNEGTQDELIAVNGIGPVLALKIVKHRPYKSEQQPLDDNVIPPSAFEALRGHVKRSA